MSSFIRAALLVAGLAVSVHAQDTALTIYSSAAPGAIPPELYRPSANPNPYAYYAYQPVQELGYAVVRQEREIAIGAGRSRVRFTDVASQIDPTTVTFSSLTDPATRVLEQNFQFDLVSNEKLLQKFIDKPGHGRAGVGNSRRTYTGTLLSSSDGLVLRGSDGSITALREYSARANFPELPGGLITRPTLEWAAARAARRASSDARDLPDRRHHLVGRLQPGLQRRQGCEQRPARPLGLGQHHQPVGRGYDDAKLKLIAGDVHRAPRRSPRWRAMVMAGEMAMDEDACGLRAEGVLRVPPLHARAPRDAAEQLDQADRAVRPGEAGAGEEGAGLLRPRRNYGWARR
jgi:hypothetical protein